MILGIQARLVIYIYIDKNKIFDIYPNAAEENWRTLADQLMKEEVKVYDQYLTEGCWGFQILDEEFEEVDSCFGFYGKNLYENGMSDYLPEAVEAIENGSCSYGKIKVIPRHSYAFEED